MKKKVLAFIAAGFTALYLLGLQPSSCPATATMPIAVSPSIMVRLYRDNPKKADQLYLGKRIHLVITGGAFRLLDYPPILVCDPPSDGKTSVTVGTCLGRVDSEYRGDQCYFVILFDCCEHHP